MSTTRLTIDIEVADYLLDLAESHMDTSMLVYQTLIPELSKVGEVCSCRILISKDGGALESAAE